MFLELRTSAAGEMKVKQNGAELGSVFQHLPSSLCDPELQLSVLQQLWWRIPYYVGGVAAARLGRSVVCLC